METETFKALVERALRDLPPEFKELLHNVAVLVKARPGPEFQGTFEEEEALLGLYVGNPLPSRSVFDNYPYPDMIFIYQSNIERICGSRKEIVDQVRKTVIHEIGHYFGLGDEELP